MSRSFLKNSRWLFVVILLLSVIFLCGHAGVLRPAAAEAKITGSPAIGEEEALDRSNPGIQTAIAVQERHTKQLMAIPDVVGTAAGLTVDGRPAVKVFTKRVPAQGVIPESLEGLTVIIRVTGDFFAVENGSPAATGKKQRVDRTARFDRPVPIGVSTGNEGECSAGTIGARVKKSSGAVYALSNNHVYALENAAPLSSRILQPGRYDTGCVLNLGDVIGQLADYEPLLFNGSDNDIDAAIASSTPEQLGNSTPSDGYGTPKSAYVSAEENAPVQKYGRTSGLTKGIIDGINATINVSYESGIATFVDQIVVYSGKPFLKAGDSGSLLVTDPGRNPVGLLFAGNTSGKYAIANRIDLVLEALNVTIDGE